MPKTSTRPQTKKYITPNTKRGKQALQYLHKQCDKALNFCQQEGLTTLEDFAEALEEISASDNPKLAIEAKVNEGGLAMRLKQAPDLGYTTGKYLMQHLGYEAQEDLQKFTRQGIENFLNPDAELDELEDESDFESELKFALNDLENEGGKESKDLENLLAENPPKTQQKTQGKERTNSTSNSANKSPKTNSKTSVPLEIDSVLNAAADLSQAAVLQTNEVDGFAMGGTASTLAILTTIVGKAAATKLMDMAKNVQQKGQLSKVAARLKTAQERADKLAEREENIQEYLTETNPNQEALAGLTEEQIDEEEQFAVEADSNHSPLNPSDHPVNRLAQAVSQLDRQINKSQLTDKNENAEPIVDANASFDEQLKQINKALERIEKRLDNLERRIEALEQTLQDSKIASDLDKNETNLIDSYPSPETDINSLSHSSKFTFGKASPRLAECGKILMQLSDLNRQEVQPTDSSRETFPDLDRQNNHLIIKDPKEGEFIVVVYNDTNDSENEKTTVKLYANSNGMKLLDASYNSDSQEWSVKRNNLSDAGLQMIEQWGKNLLPNSALVSEPNNLNTRQVPPPIPSATLYFDGGSRGNPGMAAGAAVLITPDGETHTAAVPLEAATNNQAEYAGLIAGLKKARELEVTRLEVKGDSQLVINQVTGEYQVKNPTLQALHAETQSLLSEFDQVDFTWVERSENALADAAVNQCLDKWAVNTAKTTKLPEYSDLTASCACILYNCSLLFPEETEDGLPIGNAILYADQEGGATTISLETEDGLELFSATVRNQEWTIHNDQLTDEDKETIKSSLPDFEELDGVSEAKSQEIESEKQSKSQRSEQVKRHRQIEA
jgi:ribonuclease HI